MEQRDVITFKPAPVKIISDEKTLAVLSNRDFNPVFKALRRGPMTVREILEAYNEEAKHNRKYEGKSDKTIYRYLKILEKTGLVVPAGQRVTIGKTATETLFARTAQLFVRYVRPQTWWDSKEGYTTVENLGKLFNVVFGWELKSVDCLKKVLSEVQDVSNREIERLIETADKQTTEIFTKLDVEDLHTTFYELRKIIPILKMPKLFQKLRNCFRKAK